MHRWTKHLVSIPALIAVSACSSPSGCTDPQQVVQPLPAGFDAASRVENAASGRITESGLAFLQDNLTAFAIRVLESQDLAQNGVLSIAIPTATLQGDQPTQYEVTLCPDGPDETTGSCNAEVDLGASTLSITPAAPHDLVVQGTVPIRLKRLPVRGSATLLGAQVPFDVDVAVSQNDECDPAKMAYQPVQMTVRLSVEAERSDEHAVRKGMAQLRVVSVELDNQAEVLESFHTCGQGVDDQLVDLLKGVVGDSVVSTLKTAVQNLANEQLCVRAQQGVAQPCPPGSNDVDGVCRYEDGACVPMLVGAEGHLDLEPVLASVLPGASGAFDFLLAAGGLGARDDDATMRWGDLNPVGNGATLGLVGGLLANPQSLCVPEANLLPPTGIPIPDELRANTLDGWTGEGPHVGLAISERFLNYALGAAYNSGALCVGASTEQVGQLSTGLFGLLVPSIKYLTYQKRSAPVAVTLRPQKPPVVQFGGGTNLQDDPLVRLRLEQAMVDFYVWSSDRFIRAFTAQFDLEVPVGLDVSPDGLTPQLEKIYVSNASVSNSELLREQPHQIAGALADAIQGLAGQFLGGFEPIDISEAAAPLGVKLAIQKDSIKKLTKGDDAFLGLFASFELAPSSTTAADTSVRLVSQTAQPEGFRLATHTKENSPRVVLRASSSADHGSQAVEYSYRLDRGFWHAWSPSADIVVDDPYLMLQGQHTIEVKSRVAGQPYTEDRSPALVTVTFDVDAPSVHTVQRAGRVRIEASDLVSPPEAIKVRFGFDDEPLGDWTDLKALQPLTAPEGAASVTIEAMDEAGNVRRTTEPLRLQATAAGNSAAASGACSCSTSGVGMTATGAGWAVAALGAAVIASRKRKQRRASRVVAQGAAALGVLALSGSWAGCNCTDDVQEVTHADEGRDAGSSGNCGTWGAPACATLSPGLVGAYTSATVAADGTIWVAGYNEGDWDNDMPYGDLVVGRWDEPTKRVQWQSVDGVPAEPAPDPAVYDLKSWRGGQTEPGDDVGLWSSLALDASGQPRVAYFDATNNALKFAAFDGSAWTISTVYRQDQQEAGRYAKLAIVDGKLVIAFQVIEGGAQGLVRSRVVLARSSSTVPGDGGWSMQDVAVEEATPCRHRLCAQGFKCIASTLACTKPTNDCDPKCTSGQACVSGTCEAVIDGNKLDTYPMAIGDYISLAVAPDGKLGIVYYDRVRGNLVQAREAGGSWSTKIIDGQSGGSDPVDTGDVGVGASLAIDAQGHWHVVYVDKSKSKLRYLRIENGETALPFEVVDEGDTLNGQPFADGKHWVGDDAHVAVLDSGEVHVVYQDATAGTLRHAFAPASSAAHTWTKKVLAQDGFGGFFPRLVRVGGELRVVSWWRKGGARTEANVTMTGL